MMNMRKMGWNEKDMKRKLCKRKLGKRKLGKRKLGKREGTGKKEGKRGKWERMALGSKCTGEGGR